MSPSIAELIDALPAEATQEPSSDQRFRELFAALSEGPVPVGRLTRGWALGSLQAKIAAGYVAWWLERGGSSEDAPQRELDRLHFSSALRLLGVMGYLKGSIMKLGQLLSHWPQIVPSQFAAVLGRLHFEAPPMHFALLREFVHGELGADPEALFDDFEPVAFAAASLGQVHRARLKGTRRQVAIKIQYPNMARTVREDFANMKTLLLPMRLSADWDNILAQLEEVCRMLELELDYEKEAENLRIARLAFSESDSILVPAVHPELSTKRVLTMEYLPGVHLKHFVETGPTRTERDRFGSLITRALMRLWYRERLIYADPHPGNFLFLPDGRLGVIDFGCCRRFSDQEFELLSELERATQSSREQLKQALIRAAVLTPEQERDPERIRLLFEYGDWLAEPSHRTAGAFDFGDRTYFERGLNVYRELFKRRYVRSHPVNAWTTKSLVGLRAILTELEARVDYGGILREETSGA